LLVNTFFLYILPAEIPDGDKKDKVAGRRKDIIPGSAWLKSGRFKIKILYLDYIWHSPFTALRYTFLKQPSLYELICT
jgi:hypothetical protein